MLRPVARASIFLLFFLVAASWLTAGIAFVFQSWLLFTTFALAPFGLVACVQLVVNLGERRTLGKLSSSPEDAALHAEILRRRESRRRDNTEDLKSIFSALFVLVYAISLPMFMGLVFRREFSPYPWEELPKLLAGEGIVPAVLTLALYVLIYAGAFMLPRLIFESKLNRSRARFVILWSLLTFLLFSTPLFDIARILVHDFGSAPWRAILSVVFWVFWSLVTLNAVRRGTPEKH